MPEAAEVTVAARQLDAVAVGRVLARLDVTHPRTTRSQPVDVLERFVGRRVTGVRRHGKWILAAFAGTGDELGIHLRMSGQLLAVAPETEPPDRHVHAILALGPRTPTPRPPNTPVLVAETAVPTSNSPTRTDGWVLSATTAVVAPGPPAVAAGVDDAAVDIWFRDPRTFGELRWMPDGAPVAADLFDPAVTPAVLEAGARRRRVGVKAVLLDQLRTVSGIGSYLADEALHRAGISPVRPADSLEGSAWTRILDATRQITLASAAVGGVTLPDEGWIDLWDRPGRFAPELRVHGRRMCASCGTAVRTATVGGRSARWCPRCQHANRRR